MPKILTIPAALVGGLLVMLGRAAAETPIDDLSPFTQSSSLCTPCHTSDAPTPENPRLRPCIRGEEPIVSSTAGTSVVPDVVILDELVNLYSPVSFDHRVHAEMVSRSGGCGTCHHRTPGATEAPACKTCHSASSVTVDSRMPGLKGAYHRQCMSCHREWSHETACTVCHLPMTSPGVDSVVGPADGFVARPASITAAVAYVYDTGREVEPIVTFHHLAHAEMYGQQCVACHSGDSCIRCHDRSVERPHVNRVAGCFGCHAESNCGFCHKSAAQPPFEHATSVGWSLEPHHDRVACVHCHGTPSSFTTPDSDCQSCHRPGGFRHAAASSSRDCRGCHDEVVEAASAMHHQHPALLDGCLGCHEPGTSDESRYLREEMPGLCLSCHPEVDRSLADARVVHGATASARSCTSCHLPHGAPEAHLLARPASELCLGCHDHRIDRGDARPLQDIAGRLANCPDHHGPVREGGCIACHDPHAADCSRLLRAEYPDDLYAAFDADTYELCFGCHDSGLVATRQRHRTGFRDGPTNLHAVHVARTKGRTCRACHDVHASLEPFHLRDAVPFGSGGWTFSLEYEQLPDGGRCAPACHAPQQYARMQETIDRLGSG